MNEVGYFKDLGLKFVEGDTNTDGFRLNEFGAEELNKLKINDEEVVFEFAWRTNTGEQPSYTGVIEVKFRDLCSAIIGVDGVKYWELSGSDDDIIEWRPILQSNKNTVEYVVKSVVDSDLVYTQEMFDNGELPKVGMRFDGGEVMLGMDSDGMFVTEESGEWVVCALSGIKPVKADEQILRDELCDFAVFCNIHEAEAGSFADKIINNPKFTITLNKD